MPVGAAMEDRATPGGAERVEEPSVNVELADANVKSTGGMPSSIDCERTCAVADVPEGAVSTEVEATLEDATDEVRGIDGSEGPQSMASTPTACGRISEESTTVELELEELFPESGASFGIAEDSEISGEYGESAQDKDGEESTLEEDEGAMKEPVDIGRDEDDETSLAMSCCIAEEL